MKRHNVLQEWKSIGISIFGQGVLAVYTVQYQHHVHWISQYNTFVHNLNLANGMPSYAVFYAGSPATWQA